MVRDRTWPAYEGKDKQAAFHALYYSLDRIVALLAPICPFISEEIYQGIKQEGTESVHMRDFPEANESLIDPELEARMTRVRQVSEAMDSARQDAGLKLRYPAKRVLVSGIDMKGLESVLATRCNVKSIEEFEAPNKELIEKQVADGKAYLDTEQTPALLEEALIREFERSVQRTRKQEKLKVEERIQLTVSAGKEEQEKLSRHLEGIKANVGASAIEFAEISSPKGECVFKDSKILIDIEKV